MLNQNKIGMLFALVITTMILTGCNNQDFPELRQYIASVKTKPAGNVNPLPEFKNVDPFLFRRDSNLRDPFKPVELVKVDEEPEEDLEPDNGIHPDLTRPKEALEAFPLAALKMAGTINMNNSLWGLIKADKNNIYRVKVGDYIGTNYGKITKIEKTKIDIVEIIQSTPKRFVEQNATLTLTQ